MKYFLIGIKGSGMSALACILKQLGANVSGSDVDHHYFTDDKLHAQNIDVLTFDPANITPDIDQVIIGNAFSEEHEEYQQAKALGIPIMHYYDFVESLVQTYYSIAVCGTNGKTTTTGMLSNIIDHEQLITLIGDGTGIAGKDPQTFVFEACEYKNTFLHYHPNVCVITNIEMDHPDFFNDINAMVDSYQRFANQAEVVIYNNDDINCQKITHENKHGFGIDNPDAEVNLIDLTKTSEGVCFKLVIDGFIYGPYNLPLFGMHMVYNALSSISVGHFLGMKIDTIIERLEHFTGVSRRFNIKELDANRQIYLIDDYAHHPTSIRLTLNGIRQKYPNYTITCLFQAHTYSRVNMFHREFAKSLSIADNVYIDDIFGSIREQTPAVSKQVMIDDLHDLGAHVITNLDEILTIKDHHIIALLGAGDIDTYMIPTITKMINEME